MLRSLPELVSRGRGMADFSSVSRLHLSSSPGRWWIVALAFREVVGDSVSQAKKHVSASSSRRNGPDDRHRSEYAEVVKLEP